MMLLDTNMLSPERVAEESSRLSGSMFVSSVSAQELLGMQRPDKEAGYRYALPILDERTFTARRGIPPEMLIRWITDHAKSQPVSKQTDRQVVPRSRLRAESLELGHMAVAAAHAQGNDGLLRAFASRGLRGKVLKRVLNKWEFLRNEVEALIPLDAEIAARAVLLANLFVDDKNHVKGTARNTLNDLFVAATSQIMGMPLMTHDAQLIRFYRQHGWKVRETESAFVVIPSLGATPAQTNQGPRVESRGYINRPPHIRSHVDYSRPPTLR